LVRIRPNLDRPSFDASHDVFENSLVHMSIGPMPSQ
jgi:hypothetical protein